MTPKHKNSSLGRSRDFGIPTNGKGDASRVTNLSAYAANFEAINWGHNPKPTVDYAETEGEWPDVMGVGPTVSTPVTIDILRE